MKKIIYLLFIFILSIFLVSCAKTNYNGEYEGTYVAEHIAISSIIPNISLSINNNELIIHNEVMGKLEEIIFKDDLFSNEEHLQIEEGYSDIIKNIKFVKKGLYVEIPTDDVIKLRHYIISYKGNLYYMMVSYNDNAFALIRCYKLAKK